MDHFKRKGAMGTAVYGIAAAENTDNIGELIKIEGLDISHLRVIKDEHPEQDSFFHIIGGIKFATKIFSDKDCKNDKQKRCWNFAQVPFVYIEGELADNQGHPNADAAAAIIKFSQREEIPLNVGFSIDGNIVERRDRAGNITEDKKEGKILSRTFGVAASMTVKPCNPKCRMFLEGDLTKSIACAPIPKVVLDAIQRQNSSSSFRDINSNGINILLKISKLKKSLEDYLSALTSVRCNKCGHALRFLKSGNVPNGCGKCGSPYSISQLWKALNK